MMRLGLALVCVFAASCGMEDGHMEFGKSKFSYSYVSCSNCQDVNGKCHTSQSQCSWGGCTTGKQLFASKEAACRGLQDHSLNNSCDAQGRKMKFEDLGCIGIF